MCRGDEESPGTSIEGRMKLGRNGFASEVNQGDNAIAWDSDVTVPSAGTLGKATERNFAYLF